MSKLKKISFVLLVTIMLLLSCQNDYNTVFYNKNPKKILKNHTDTISYCLGLNIGRTFTKYGINQVNTRVLMMAIDQVLQGTNADSFLINPQVAEQILKIYLYKEKQQSIKFTEQRWKKFMEQNAKRKGVVVLKSGLQYEVLQPGHGPRPLLSDYVKVQYKGYLPDGTVFDNNYLRSPAVFRVSSAIEGWQQALIRMRQGAKWRIYLPPYLAFGNRQVGKIPPNSPVIYEIKLLEIKHIK